MLVKIDEDTWINPSHVAYIHKVEPTQHSPSECAIVMFNNDTIYPHHITCDQIAAQLNIASATE